MIRWHYAFAAGGLYYEPVCVGRREELKGALVNHGITINRGEVTCPACLKAMGVV